jgi:two-component system sensor histidine kinase KdpD
VVTLTATSVAQALIDYAVKNNVTKIVVGKPTKPRWREFLQPPLVDQIIRLSGTIDVYVVSIADAEKKPKASVVQTGKPVPWSGYMKSLALVIAASALCELVRPFLAPTNLVMIYLLAVVLAATRLGLKPAILTAFLSVLFFGFFFVPPRLSFTSYNPEYLLTFAALFTVGVVISTLVSQTRERAEAIRKREVQTSSLYYLSRDLAAAGDVEGILQAAIKNVEESLEARLVVFLAEGKNLQIKAASHDLHLDMKELAVADWSFNNRMPAGRGTETLISSSLLYLPLQTTAGVLGVFGIKLKGEADFESQEHRRLLNAFVFQATLAIERVLLAKQAEQAKILQAREGLERALLNSISHDLRTPLMSISVALDNLWEKGAQIAEKVRRDLLTTAREETKRLNRFVGNLLDMTRLEAGAVQLKEVPCDVQDLVGCALGALEQRIGARKIDVRLPSSLQPVGMDLALMTQVLVNLLDNALKYSPPDKSIEIAARTDADKLTMEIADHGPGVPEGDLTRVFDKFYRIPIPEGAGGTGLGLAICKGIVEAHGGDIRAENQTGGGLRVTITLPIGEDE